MEAERAGVGVIMMQVVLVRVVTACAVVPSAATAGALVAREAVVEGMLLKGGKR